jgi:mono/diheme cytochrome c family protein
MKRTVFVWIVLVVLISACSLAEDVTPPPALATAQAGPVQGEAPTRPTAEVVEQEPVSLNPPVSVPSLFSGAAIYLESCEPCHGPTGMGDGSMASNLEVPPPPLGDPSRTQVVAPIDWYQVVTEGRMDRFMPPFSSLSDAQRWDVVAYALSLSYPIAVREQGAALFAEYCAGCHGDQGEGAEVGPALNSLEGFADHSLDQIRTVIQQGRGNMPAFGSLTEDQQQTLAAYVQSLGTIVHGETPTAEDDSDPATEPQAAGQTSGDEPSDAEQVSLGSISGVVTNGTADGILPDDLTITLVALEGNVPVLEEELSVASDGSFAREDLEIIPGRIYGALVEYQDVVYYSVGGHLLQEAPDLELPIMIYETTPDESSVTVDRLHLIFDYSLEGLVEISELWLLSTPGDRTVVQRGGANALPIRLPEGANNVRFPNAVSPDQFSVIEGGFVAHDPIRPDESLEVVVTFTLPYQRSLTFSQDLNFPVDAVVILAESDTPAISGEGLQDLGERDMGGMVLRNYALAALPAGTTLELDLRGAHPLAATGLSNSNLAIGLGAFGVALIAVAAGLWIWNRRGTQVQMVESEGVEEPRSRNQLLQAIASLDDAYEAGDIEQSDYEQQRASLKNQLVKRMQDD